jgi:type IV pilus assembly protein PilO
MGQSSRKILIILAVVVVLVVLYFFLMYRPKAAEITNYTKDLADIQRDKEEKQKIVADLDQFNREVVELEKRLNEALAQLPNDKEIDQILEQLASLVRDSGLRLESFKVMSEIPRQLYNEVPMALEISGNYHNIALFFDKASKLKRIINFSNLELGTPRQERGETVVSVSCTATTFRFVKGGGAKAPTKKPATPPRKKH